MTNSYLYHILERKKSCFLTLVYFRVEFDPDTQVRLIRSTAVRLVQEEEDVIKVYYSTENTREYHELEEQWLEVDSDTAPGVDFLINAYPAWSKVRQVFFIL